MSRQRELEGRTTSRQDENTRVDGRFCCVRLEPDAMLFPGLCHCRLRFPVLSEMSVQCACFGALNAKISTRKGGCALLLPDNAPTAQHRAAKGVSPMMSGDAEKERRVDRLLNLSLVKSRPQQAPIP